MTRDPPDDTGLLNRFITMSENLHDTMTGTDRGLSLGIGAALAVAALVIVVAVVFLGTTALGGNGGPADAGNQTTTTAPAPTSTDKSTTTTKPTTTSKPTTTAKRSSVERVQSTFADNLSFQNRDLEVIDMVVRNDTLYVTTHGPAQGGPAVGTAGEIGQAFADTMEPVWEGDIADVGIDHAVVKLYNETDYHWFTMRVEESWAYRYHTGDMSGNVYSSLISSSQHKIGDTTELLDMDAFRTNVSGMEGIEIRSLEQYGRIYFATLEMDDFSGDEYNQTLFEISEAFYDDQHVPEALPVLDYVIYAENGTAVISDTITTTDADLWHDGELTDKYYRYTLVAGNYDATQIPGGIDSMLTRIQPFPAEGPGE